ncbi:zinc-binding region-containing partial [Plasmopara halstedii]|uniref:Zinc-binding region-containing partial n=1 Tax=Plasmopara halstedii TaxID=4781 RepID=A0A0P1ACW5_PLAHL|nr:zinc-binding region-containing partial [Plasmopara halstedii]CEG38302.1 zinc-binding region-containing partial [Plasmopara halstedii]
MIFRKVALVSRSVNTIARCHFTIATNAKINGNNRDKPPNDTLSYVPENSDGRFYIEQLNEQWRSTIAGQKFHPNDIIGSALGSVYSEPTRFTVQVTPDKHMYFTGGLEFVNHSCDPNTRIDISESEAKVSFIAIKPINQGEPLTFDYSTSEWDMDEKFKCSCGSFSCRGDIKGAKYLTDDEVTARLPYFTPSVLRQLLNRKLTC